MPQIIQTSSLVLALALMGCQATPVLLIPMEYARQPDGAFQVGLDTVLVESGNEIASYYDGVWTETLEFETAVLIATQSEGSLDMVGHIPSGRYSRSHRDAQGREIYLFVPPTPRKDPVPFYIRTPGFTSLEVGLVDNGVPVPLGVFSEEDELSWTVYTESAPVATSEWRRLLLGDVVRIENDEWRVKLISEIYRSGGVQKLEFNRVLSTWRHFDVVQASMISYQGWVVRVVELQDDFISLVVLPFQEVK